MLLRTTILIPLLVLGLGLSPGSELADAATPARVTLNVTGAGHGATFFVRGTLYWDYANDPVNIPANNRWSLEYEFHGMDSGSSDIVATFVVPLTRGTSLQQNFAVAVGNSSRWANEDRDRLFRKRRDEIRVIVYVRYDGRRYMRAGTLSNEVTGNF